MIIFAVNVYIEKKCLKFSGPEMHSSISPLYTEIWSSTVPNECGSMSTHIKPQSPGAKN